MKKFVVCAAALASLVSLNAVAGNTYVGADLGYRTVTTNSNIGSKFRGWLPGLFIGYGTMTVDNYYLAGEFAANWVSETSNSYTMRSQSLRISPEYTLSFIPGMVLKPELLGFLRIGIGEGRLAAQGDWLLAGVMGVGLEYTLTPCWNLRGEFDYSVFHDTSVGTPNAADFVLALKYTYDA